jgi:D-sedoheptulose 7-phosphate isomerase
MAEKRIARALQEHAALAASFASQTEALAACAQELAALFHRGGRLLTLGSGPSGAISNLTASLFLHRLALERPLLPAVSLCHDAVLATALARDGLGHDFFVRQLRSLAGSGDLLLAFAGAPLEEAVVQALAAAREIGCVTAVVIQGAGEALAEPPDFLFRLATDSVPRAVEGCLLFAHLLVELVEGELFGI